jgi:DNA-binding NarL/FixJ family response regulator
MDITMPELNGIDATRQITAEMPDTRVIALSMHSERQFIQGMLAAGVSGYLLKDCAFDELIGAVRAVLRGKTYLSPDIAGVVVEGFVSRAREIQTQNGPVLTPREREVLQLIAEGVATKNIAEQLHLSVKTVESHRKHIMEKLDLHTVAELVKYAIREGLTSLDR